MGDPRVMVKDGRKRPWFWVHNAAVDMNLAGIADSVYSKLCRHADNETGKAWPGLKKWSEKKGFHYRDVSKALKLLTEKKLIEKSGRKGSQGPFIYTVLDIENDDGIANRETPEEASDFQKQPSDSHNGKPSEFHIGSRTKLKLNKTEVNKTKNAGPKDPAPFKILGEQWCEFVKLDIKQLTNKDWKAIYQHDKKGADIDQLKALSEVAWKEKKHDLTYLYGQRASLLPKIKPKSEKTFYTPEELFGEGKK